MLLNSDLENIKGVGKQKAKLLYKELKIKTIEDALNYFPFRYEDKTKTSSISELKDYINSNISICGTINSVRMAGGNRLVAEIKDDTASVELVWFRGMSWIGKQLKPGMTITAYGKPTSYNNKINIKHPELNVYTNSENDTIAPVYKSTEVLARRFLNSKGIAKIQREIISMIKKNIADISNIKEINKENDVHDNVFPDLKNTLNDNEYTSKNKIFIVENLPSYIIEKESLMDRQEAFLQIHCPSSLQKADEATKRLKFEELFYLQIRINKGIKTSKKESREETLKTPEVIDKNNSKIDKNLFHNKEDDDPQKGFIFKDRTLLDNFLSSELDFTLTNAQERVIKEIYRDMSLGKHMNRLLQGDVGSGKTVIALMSILIAISNKCQSVLKTPSFIDKNSSKIDEKLSHNNRDNIPYQATMMAPTEILAEQHYNTLKSILDNLGIKSSILTGSTKTRLRKDILAELEMGYIKVLFGTHSLIEDTVVFKNLGLAVIDEQHRFGVAQRSKLWKKNMHNTNETNKQSISNNTTSQNHKTSIKENIYALPPHILVMTATPIPRTLAMTAYGNLDVSVLDEMPKGRKPIKTAWLKDSSRLKLFDFIKEQVNKGRQVYIVYPLIEESKVLDYKYLEDGYEGVKRAFPDIPIGVLHGRMRPEDKDYEMDLFVKGKTKIMVATTVIEVGINIPNATLMVIESAERFGLSQLHQLRGRVGRGTEQSYCVLVSGYKLTKDSKERLATMVRTTDGFEIADSDLKLRGPGNILGTQQSGLLELKIADIAKDEELVTKTRDIAKNILKNDPKLIKKENEVIKDYIKKLAEQGIDMTGIS